nr:UDP-N-acetylmuramate dehydrogenase [Zoogloeaceae bacterium]
MPPPTNPAPPVPALEHDADLQPLNTFGLPARASRLLTITDPAQLALLLAAGGSGFGPDSPRLVLGGGSNIVLRGDFDGWVFKVAIRGRKLVASDDETVIVEAGAGENWHALVRWTLDQGWPGLENLSLIPGTVGAAPIQNIGAYGLEIVDRFDSLDAVSLDDGRTRCFTRADCRFGYRDSVFKHAEASRWLITQVRLRLPRRWQPLTRYADVAAELAARELSTPTAVQISDAIATIRRRKLPDPALIGNAGSFFKNPVVDAVTLSRLLTHDPDLPHYPQADGTAKLAAGWLIDRCGWKGRRLGPVGCFERQALVLVNHGGATGPDVLAAAAAIQADVRARFGVALEPEPLFV